MAGSVPRINKDAHPTAAAPMPASDTREQVAALCFKETPEGRKVLLVTSRDTGRWIVPKGWPVKGKDGPGSALQEAWEEAGAAGKMKPVCIGVYGYRKQMGDDDDLPCMVNVFPLKVKKLADDFPERKERRRKWFSLKKAAKKVDEPELAEIISRFDATSL